MKTVGRAVLVLEDTPHPTPAIPRLWRNLNETCHIYRVGPLLCCVEVDPLLALWNLRGETSHEHGEMS